MSVNIFDPNYKVQTNTFKHKVIGDKIQGTLVGKRVTTNRLKNGEDQLVYDLKLDDGSIVSVFGKPGIDYQMKAVKLGQIVGMEYTKDLPPKVQGHSATHVIQVFADPKVVDQEWLNEQEEAETAHMAAQSFGGQVVSTPAFVNPLVPSFLDTPEPPKPPRAASEVLPFTSAPPAYSQPSVVAPVPVVAPTMAGPSKEETIKQLAMQRIPGTDANNYANKVMEATGVPMISMNYDKIIGLLQG